MFLVLWEFDVKPGCDERFESVYGPDGAWAQLFRRDPAYQRTLLLRDPFRDRTYVTCDFWESETAYESFRHANSDAYLALDKQFEELTLAERKMGPSRSSRITIKTRRSALCPQTRQTIGLQIGANKLLRRPGRSQDRLGGKITAANRAFHCGGPACRSPIAGEEQTTNARLLDWTPTVDAGLRGKCGGRFFDNSGLEEVGLTGGRERVTDFLQAKIDDFLARHLEEVVGSAYDQLQILPFDRGGSGTIRARIKSRFVEYPLRGGVEKGEERLRHDLPIEPEMDAGDR
jgi:hypothetical protein